MPASHVSVWVQALLSSHAVPSGLAGFEHPPVALLHVPTSWHWSRATHVTGLEPVQAPAWQVSVCVQALLSSHGVPFGFATFVQMPVALLQAPLS